MKKYDMKKFPKTLSAAPPVVYRITPMVTPSQHIQGVRYKTGQNKILKLNVICLTVPLGGARPLLWEPLG